MNKNIGSLILIAFLVTFASADFGSGKKALHPGDVLTVSVEQLPSNTKMASYSLGREAHGLLMKQKRDGSWEGKFALLPSMAGTTLEPIVTAYLDDGRTRTIELAPRKIEGDRKVAQGDGFITQDDGQVLFVFDETIRLNTVSVQTRSGLQDAPRYENNYFKLPAGVKVDDIVAIRAQSIHGESLRIEPDASLQASR